MSLKQKTILIVDDDTDILALLRKILAPTGLNVLTATGPEEARVYLADAPHVILSDLHMEPEDGFSFIRTLKEDRRTQNIPVLVLSALNDFGSVKKAIGLGVKDYVVKPLQAPVLLRKLRKVLLNQEYLHWDVAESEKIFIEVKIRAKIEALAETGYHLSGPFKLAPGAQVKASSQVFDELRLASVPQKTSPLMKTYLSEGRFINDVTFLGIDEDRSSEIRKYLGKRRRS